MAVISFMRVLFFYVSTNCSIYVEVSLYSVPVQTCLWCATLALISVKLVLSQAPANQLVG